MLKRLLDALLVQGELLNHGLDVVDRGELHHLIINRPRRNDGPLHAKAVHDERHIWEFEIAIRDGEWVYRSFGSEYGGIERVIWLGARGDEEVVDGFDLLEVLGAFNPLHGVDF